MEPEHVRGDIRYVPKVKPLSEAMCVSDSPELMIKIIDQKLNPSSDMEHGAPLVKPTKGKKSLSDKEDD